MQEIEQPQAKLAKLMGLGRLLDEKYLGRFQAFLSSLAADPPYRLHWVEDIEDYRTIRR